MKKNIELISKKRIDKEESPLKEPNIMAVELYRIKEGTIIPKEALDPGVWDIPEGYYAIEHRESLD